MINLMLGDCLELMREIPDGSVDMVLCDLPYGTTQNKWDSVIPFDLLWKQYHRITKINAPIVLNCMQPFTSALIMSNPKEFKYLWYWDKHLKTGFLNAKKQPLRQVEEIAVFYRKQPLFTPPVIRRGKRLTYKAGNTVSRCYGKQNREGLTTETDVYCATTLISNCPKQIFKHGHPTEKPVSLLEYLIKTYTKENDVVLDNTMGSGSTGVACVNTLRSFIGIELDEKYFNTAKERIENAQYNLVNMAYSE